MEPRHVALVGKSHQLAVYELARLLSRYSAQLKPISEPYFWEIVGTIDPQQLMRQSGGLVKIYRLIDQPIADVLISAGEDHFCLSSLLHGSNLKGLAQQTKEALRSAGLKAHFKLLSDPFYSANFTTRYTEFCLIQSKPNELIGQAVAVQDLELWTKKDYGRPAFDPSSGMLPPKVARMMVNAGLPDQLTPETTIYDPMCGSGTILLEGLDLGLNVIGSDLSAKAIAASNDNAAWFGKTFEPTGKFNIFEADATHVSLADLGQPVDAIVFEGYLGPPFPKPDQVSNLIKGLEKLYKGVFKNLYPLLNPGGYLVCALPQYAVNSGVKNLDTLVDWTATLGYTRRGHFTYGRSQAFVKRSIYILQKKE